MSSPFDVYRETYYDQSVTDHDGNVIKRKQDDHDEPKIETTAAVIPEEFIEPRTTVKMIKG